MCAGVAGIRGGHAGADGVWASVILFLAEFMEKSPPICCHYVLQGGHIPINSAKNKNSGGHGQVRAACVSQIRGMAV